MNTDNFSDRLILKPNALKNLAGIENESSDDILTYIDEEEFFKNIGNETVSVEIMTLSQYKYESAFDYIMSKQQEESLSIDDMTELVERNLTRFDHLQPVIKVQEFGIMVIVDFNKIDATVVDYVSSILTKLPSSAPGYEWKYLEDN